MARKHTKSQELILKDIIKRAKGKEEDDPDVWEDYLARLFRTDVDLVVEGDLFNNYEVSWHFNPDVQNKSHHKGSSSDNYEAFVRYIGSKLKRASFSVSYLDSPSSMVPIMTINEEGGDDYALSLWHQYRRPILVMGSWLILTNLLISIPLSNMLIASSLALSIILTTMANTFSGIVSGIIAYYYSTKDSKKVKTRKRYDLPGDEVKEIMTTRRVEERVKGDPVVVGGLYTGKRWDRDIYVNGLCEPCRLIDMTVYALTATDSIIKVEETLDLSEGESVKIKTVVKTHFKRNLKTGDHKWKVGSTTQTSVTYINGGYEWLLVADSQKFVSVRTIYSHHGYNATH